MKDDTYLLRFFFDAGSGTCLWAGNNSARARYGYAIDPEVLPVSADVRARVHGLVREYDTSIDWDYPPDPSPWSLAQSRDFETRVQATLHELRSALAPTHVIQDERSAFEPHPE